MRAVIWTFLTTIALFVGLLSVGQGAKAQTFNIQGVAAFDILTGYPTANGHIVAARIRMKPGWKTYWRVADGSGIPPRFSWDGSRNLAGVTYHWPAPSVYSINNIRTIGYENQLILPIEVTPRQSGEPIHLKGRIDFGICEEVCLPVSARFSVPLSSTSQGTDLIKATLKKRPVQGKSAGIRNLSCRITPVEDGFRIEARLTLPKAPTRGTFAVLELAGADTWIEEGPFTANGGQVTAVSTLYPLTDGPFILDRSRLRITLLGGRRAIEMRGCPNG